MPRQSKRLTASFVKAVSEPGKYHDEHGLILRVQGAAKSWVWRGVIANTGGRRVDRGIGRYPYVTLVEARQAAFEHRRIALKGTDPREERPAANVPTFADCVESTIKAYASSWTNAKIERQWRSTFSQYTAPLMAKRCDLITARDLLRVVSPVWTLKPSVGKRLLQRLSVVFRRCVVEGHRPDDPTVGVTAALPKQKAAVEHREAIPFSGVGAALRKIEASDTPLAARLSVMFQTLTATRPSEARLMTWAEVDGDTWTIPSARAKMRRPHRVPLSDQAIAVLERAREAFGGEGLVFPGRNGKALSAATAPRVFQSLRLPGTAHGMRASFRMWSAEKSDAPREVCEFALGHVVGSAAEQAYQRSDLFNRRAALMQAWADYMTG